VVLALVVPLVPELLLLLELPVLHGPPPPPPPAPVVDVVPLPLALLVPAPVLVVPTPVLTPVVPDPVPVLLANPPPPPLVAPPPVSPAESPVYPGGSGWGLKQPSGNVAVAVTVTRRSKSLRIGCPARACSLVQPARQARGRQSPGESTIGLSGGGTGWHAPGRSDPLVLRCAGPMVGSVTETTSGLEGIAERLAEVRRGIDEAVRAAGRAPGSVRLVAVSKKKPAEAIRAAYAAGQRDFGENYVQELVEKAEALADLKEIRWHAIGPIQRNKAKLVVRVARMVHTVDREDLAAELEKRAAAAGVTIDALVEVNVSGEASKAGCPPSALGALLDTIRRSPHLRASGLMTLPPADEDPGAARPVFAALRALRDQHGGATALPELSMGMTHDYPIAVAEGATMVRVGTAIFGARDG
jgi:PLP dependent protein